MKPQNVKVTTTSGFDGAEITEYMEPITAHVVVGMNFFKDFISGFSDFFGGKSKTYQDTLSSINDEVINELRKKAFSIGANCVLALKIDNDEISAQGKSMMMVTAMGTAAKANFPTESIDVSIQSKNDRISSTYFSYLKEKETFKEYIKSIQHPIKDEFWTFAKKNKINEFAEDISINFCNYITRNEGYQGEYINEYTTHLSDYLSTIDKEVSIEVLYRCLREAKTSSVQKRLIKIIIETQLVDFPETIKMLKNENLEIRKLGIQVLQGNKQDYDKKSLSKLEEIKDIITSSFQERGVRTTKKKSLSSKEKEIWICECGKENDITRDYCSYCELDIYGFKSSESKVPEILKKVEQDIIILKSALN